MKAHEQHKNSPGLAGRFHRIAVGVKDQSDISSEPSQENKGYEKDPDDEPGERDKEILYPEQKYAGRHHKSFIASWKEISPRSSFSRTWLSMLSGASMVESSRFIKSVIRALAVG